MEVAIGISIGFVAGAVVVAGYVWLTLWRGFPW